MRSRVVIVDHGTGNVASIFRGFSRVAKDMRSELELVVSSDPNVLKTADRLVLAGVGHFVSAMRSLKNTPLRDALDEAVLNLKKPILGICLGLELMTKSSEEGRSAGLGWLDAETVRFRVSDSLRYKVPHTGWNRVSARKDSDLTKGIPASAEFYFLHSYHLRLSDDSLLINEALHETSFPATIERDNMFGVQFHPEKSHAHGLRLMRNFVDL